MIKSILLVFLLIMALKPLEIVAIYECCPDTNVLFGTNKSCLTKDLNHEAINLECNIKFAVKDRAEFVTYKYTLLGNGSLIDSNLRSIQYCHSKQGDHSNASSPIYIVCIEELEEDDSGKFQVQAALEFISLVFTILTIIVYAMVPSLWDLQGICIMHTLVGLALGYIFLGMVQIDSTYDTVTCEALAYLVYFSFLYLFFWLVNLSFHIWRTTVKPHLWTHTIKWIVTYHAFGIGGPVLGLVIVLLAHYSPSPVWENFRPGFGEVACWFKSSREIWIYFYGPLIVLLICDVICYLWTIIVLWRQVEDNRKKRSKYRLNLCIRLCIIMGITWIFEIITFALKEPTMSIAGKVFLFLLDLFNLLQGVMVFLVLVVFRKRVRRALASKNVCNIRFPNAWKYLEDEEMESAEAKVNCTVVEYNRDINEKSDENDSK